MGKKNPYNFPKRDLDLRKTLKQRCDMLLEHKKEVEDKIAEMQRHLCKVEHKIDYFTEQYKRYTDGQEEKTSDIAGEALGNTLTS